MSSPVGSWVDVPCENRGAAPSSRESSACAVYKDCLYVFGGYDGSTRLNDLHEFNFSRKLWRVVSASGVVPSARNDHTCVVYKNVLYVFGGYHGRSRLNDLMEFNFLTQQWSAVGADTASAPTPRSCHSAVVYGNSMFVFGGHSDAGNMNDFHEFNFETRTWSPVRATGTAPPPRYAASLVVFEGTAILFGGSGGSGTFNDLHMFDFDQRLWLTAVAEGPAPTPRSGHVAVVHSNVMYVFGGYTNTRTNDFHKLSLDPSKKRKWKTVASKGTPPHRCYDHTAALYDSSLFVFGGAGNGNNFSQFRIKNKRNRANRRELHVPVGTKTDILVGSEHKASSNKEADEVAKLRSEVTQLRIELQDNTGVIELRNELNQLRTDVLNQLRIELREDAKTLRGAVLQESTTLCKRLMAETVTQLAKLQGQAGTERSPLVRPVDPHLMDLCSCPISMDIMKDPVLTPSGVTYERAMIEQHLDRVGAFDPTTNVPLTKAELYPNRVVKDLIEKHFPNHAR